MEYIFPNYYGKFRCIANQCPDTCCAGWQIAIDKSSLKKYKNTKGIIGNRLHNEIDWKEKIFRQYDGRCAFLNDDDLCDLYLEGGEHLFCRTCKTYPRHVEEYEGLKEVSLSLSCPVVANMIIRLKEPVQFLERHRECSEEEDEQFDFLLFSKLEDAREVAFKILQNRDLAINTRIAMVLAMAHDLQFRIDKNAIFEADLLLQRYERESAPKQFEEKRKKESLNAPILEKNMLVRKFFSVFNNLEVLRSDWKPFINERKRVILATKNTNTAKKIDADCEIVWEQLMMYFVYTYFCGAVYDGRAYTRMKFSVFSTLIIRELSKSLWISNQRNYDEYEEIYQEIEEVARRYAREIEHSDFNKNMIFELLENEQDFGLQRFFAFL